MPDTTTDNDRSSDRDPSRLRSARWFAPDDQRSFGHRSRLKQMGFGAEDFEAKPVIEWVDRLQSENIDLPVHIGVAGPAKLQTLIRFAIACGVGPSLKVLQKRAMDVTKLILPYEPTNVISELAAHKTANPNFNVEQVHFFPLGGIKTNANWAINNGGAGTDPADRS